METSEKREILEQFENYWKALDRTRVFVEECITDLNGNAENDFDQDVRSLLEKLKKIGQGYHREHITSIERAKTQVADVVCQLHESEQ